MIIDYDAGCQEAKVICFVENILQLIGNQCKACPLQCKVTSKRVGCALVLKMECDAGHVFHWSSSPVIRNAKQNSVYKVNLDFASALLFSGNNYYKIRQFCSFVGVGCISASTYFAYQRLYLCPVISEYYTMKMVS